MAGPSAQGGKSIQVSGSDSSSVLVSINKHPNPYFTGETFSDRNAVADHQRNKNEILINSDTNALAVTSD